MLKHFIITSFSILPAPGKETYENDKFYVEMQINGFEKTFQTKNVCIWRRNVKRSDHHFIIIIKGLDKVVELLIQNGADVNALSPSHSTSLHYAAKFGKYKL